MNRLKFKAKNYSPRILNFREQYQADRVIVAYYPFLESRIKAFSIALKKAFSMLIIAFRLLMRKVPQSIEKGSEYAYHAFFEAILKGEQDD